ncbi:hypothetical protein WJX73_003486 [Symbiochloris irregularis]|uniref:Uncharacterized protein n=1 Tax=Symbiochloris irregularis TaxID=706552 RepID=A0AAW1PKG0_9CHLO
MTWPAAPLLSSRSLSTLQRSTKTLRVVAKLSEDHLRKAGLSQQYLQEVKKPQPSVDLLTTEAVAALLQAQMEAADLKLQAMTAEYELQLVVKDLEGMTGKFLLLKGLLSVRGMLEWIERPVVLLKGVQTTDSARVRKWQQLLAEPAKMSLVECIVKATGWKAHEIPQRIDGIYKQARYQHPWKPLKVMLVEGPLNKEQIFAAECVAKHWRIPHEIEWKQGPWAKYDAR